MFRWGISPSSQHTQQEGRLSKALEIQVINRVLSGEKDAFRYFIREYQQLAYSIAASIVKNQDDAKDVVQNAFIRSYKSIRSFKQESKFSSWLYRIVINEALAFNKKNKRTFDHVSIEDANGVIDSEFNQADIQLEAKEVKLKVNSVLQNLKPKEALIMNLHYLQEMSLKEIEESTGYTISNIKVLLYRGRKSFMKLYLNTTTT